MVKRNDDTEDEDESRSKYGIAGGEDAVETIRDTLDGDGDDDE